MNDKQIFKKLIDTKCLKAYKCNNLSLETRLIEDLGFDSYKMLDLIVQIEQLFSITIPDDELLIENFNSFSAIVQIINKYQSGENYD